MPQTVEAIDHAKAAEVPIVVAVNKIDRPDANPERVRTELTTLGLQPEEWGGSTIFVDVSAKEHTGLEHLLEMLLLQADILELKANPERRRAGRRDRVAARHRPRADRHGARAARHAQGRRRARRRRCLGQGARARGRPRPQGQGGRAVGSRRGARLRSSAARRRALPRRRVGARGAPGGAAARAAPARGAARRAARSRSRSSSCSPQIKEGGARELNLVIKADVQGSVEAAIGEVEKIKHSEVSVRVIRTGVGGIAESDVMLAAASKAIVVGFNVRPNAEAKAAAEREGVDVRTYRVIYQLTEDIQKALVGMLTPDQVEEVLGEAEVRATFRASRLGVICGCMVTSGVIQRSGPRAPGARGRGRLGGQHRLAAPRAGGRPRGLPGPRVRHPARELQRRQGRRHDRVLRHAAGRAHDARRAAAATT